MRDLVGGTKRRASFVGSHFMGICLGLLVLVLAISLLTGCAGSTSTTSTTSTTTAAGSSSAGSEQVSGGANGGAASHASDGLATVAYADLPKQAQTTIGLIDAGGPYPYPRNDDKTFGNFEGHLPQQPRGYYKEYTVPTPGASNRGARRIIVGRDGTMYYTSDHYNSFRRILR